MKAPDKLYCGIQELDTGYVYALSLDNNGEQEYIRKDALLAKIKERLKLYDPDDPDAEIACRELQSIISWIDGKEVAE